MLAKELAEILLRTPDARVMVQGYEGGLVDVTEGQVRVLPVALDQNQSGYLGPHEPDVTCAFPDAKIIDALVIHRSIMDAEE